MPEGIGDGCVGGRAVPAGLGKQRQTRVKARTRRQVDRKQGGSGMHVRAGALIAPSLPAAEMMIHVMIRSTISGP